MNIFIFKTCKLAARNFKYTTFVYSYIKTILDLALHFNIFSSINPISLFIGYVYRFRNFKVLSEILKDKEIVFRY